MKPSRLPRFQASTCAAVTAVTPATASDSCAGGAAHPMLETNRSVAGHDLTLTSSDDGSRRYDPALRHHDDAAADVVPVAVRVFHARLVDELCAVADSRVLVHDDAIEHDVAPDTHR